MNDAFKQMIMILTEEIKDTFNKNFEEEKMRASTCTNCSKVEDQIK